MPFGTDAKGKAFLKLSEVGSLEDGYPLLGDPACFSMSRTIIAGRFAVGHVYEIPVSADGTKFSLGKKSWLCCHPDSQLVEGWQATEKTRKLLAEAEAVERREASGTSRLEPHLKALRAVRFRLTAPQRLAFDVWLLNSIR